MRVCESTTGKVHVLVSDHKRAPDVSTTLCGSLLFHGGQTFFWPDAMKVTCRKCISGIAMRAGTCERCGSAEGQRCTTRGGVTSPRHKERTS